MNSEKKSQSEVNAPPEEPSTAEAAEASAADGLTDLSATGESPDWLESGSDSQRWDTIFSNELQGSDAVHGVEPTLEVTADDVSLTEPSLAPVEISNDTADAAELDEVTDEARKVAEEAEEAGRLVGGAPLPARAPAGPSTHNETDAETPPADSVDKVNGEPTPSEGNQTPEETMAPQHAAERARPAAEASARTSGWTPSSESPRPRPRGSHSAPVKTNHLPLILVGLAVLAALALIIFIVVSLVRGGDDSPAEGEAAGVIAQEVSPLEVKEGQCLQGFEDVNSEVTVVTCDTPHNAQLVSTFSYPDNAGYPGTDALRAKASEVCDSANLNSDAIRKYDNLRQTEASPGETTWSNGDRRVDCYVFTDEPEALVGSLLLE